MDFENSTLNPQQIKDISSQYSSGMIKRKLALLDTMIFALDQKEKTSQHKLNALILTDFNFLTDLNF